jgi:hypothetical protein
MTISETENISNERHDCESSRELGTTFEPGGGPRELFHEPFPKYRRVSKISSYVGRGCDFGSSSVLNSWAGEGSMDVESRICLISVYLKLEMERMNPYVKCHTFLTKGFENDISQDSSMRYPLHNPVFLVQGHYRIRPNISTLGLKTWGNTKLPTTRLYIFLEQFIDDTVELHKTCIFT